MIVKCPVCGIECREYGSGRYKANDGKHYKYILSKCEEHGDFTISVPDVAPVVMPKKRRNRYYD